MQLTSSETSFEEWIAPFYKLRPQPERGKERFESFKNLCKHLKAPGLKLPAIHITGSNGKGSVALMISGALHRSSHRVGRFSSPHLLHFSERIEVNGVPISERRVRELGEAIYEKAKAHGFSIGFFEWSFLIALEHFTLENVDLMVIEAGIGGMLDTTNVIENTLASALVSISLDHTDILGPTLEHITRDKLGILRPKRPAVFGPSVPAFADEEAKRLKAPLYRVEPKENFYEENKAVARNLLEVVSSKFRLSSKAIDEGLNAKLVGRRHVVAPYFVLDVAHNIGGVASFLQTLSHSEWKEAPLFLGLRTDKAIVECLKEAKRHSKEIYFVLFNHPLCPSKEEVQRAFKKAGASLAGLFLSAEEALEKAQSLKKKCAFIGSFFFIAAALTFLNQTCQRS